MSDAFYQVWGSSIIDAWGRVVDRFVNYLPNILGAIIILILGWILAVLLARLVDELFRSIGLQKLFESIGVERVIRKTRVDFDTTGLLASLIKWAILIITFLAATDVLGLSAITNFLNKVIGYLPEVLSATGILLVGLVAAHFFSHLVRSFAHSMELTHSGTIGAIAEYSIIVFAVIAALIQLGIASSLLLTLFTGFVAMLSLAGGLAFGLGGQGVAKEILESTKKNLTGKE